LLLWNHKLTNSDECFVKDGQIRDILGVELRKGVQLFTSASFIVLSSFCTSGSHLLYITWHE